MAQPTKELLTELIGVPVTASMKEEIERLARDGERTPPAEVRIALKKHIAEAAA